jgi:citrate lyase subunit beta/citryl-CoA lyase
MLPKACGPADIERPGRGLAAVETKAGIAAGSLGIVAIVTETAASVLALSEFRRPMPRLVAMLWGGKDLAGDLGVARNRDEGGRYREPFRLARSLMLMAAAAAECGAVDAVFVDFRGAHALALACKGARPDGFTAKAAIHPDQVGAINHVFSATAEERAWAEQVIVALGNGGVGGVDGRMVDAPHLRLALRILGGRLSA